MLPKKVILPYTTICQERMPEMMKYFHGFISGGDGLRPLRLASVDFTRRVKSPDVKCDPTSTEPFYAPAHQKRRNRHSGYPLRRGHSVRERNHHAH